MRGNKGRIYPLPLFSRKSGKGFTLIELLVVIAIIGMLSSVVLASLNSARAKARDARRQADFRQLSTALALYYDTNGTYPMNVGSNEIEFFTNMSQTLVSAGYMSSIPRDPGSGLYRYYFYSSNPSIGAVLETHLEAAPDTTTGIPPSCRPWAAYTNWCDKRSDNSYCICNTF